MADIDIDPASNHDKPDTQHDKPTGETIPFTPGGVGGSTWEPEQETSFGGTSMGTEVLKQHIKVLYHVLTKYLDRTPDAFHFDDIEIRNRELYYMGKGKTLTMPLKFEGES